MMPQFVLYTEWDWGFERWLLGCQWVLMTNTDE